MDVKGDQLLTRHDKKYFYKYVTTETALKILTTRTVRYSSPVLFNDPFDTQTRIGFDMEALEVEQMLAEEVWDLCHAEKEPVLHMAAPLSRSVKRARDVVKNSPTKMNKEGFLEWSKLKPEMVVARSIIEQQDKRINDWWARAVKASRVFCVSEEWDNLLMWAHYGDDHRGVVIEFECLVELDTPLCVARKVQYVSRPPVIGRASGLIYWMTGQSAKRPDHGSFIFNLFLSKSEHWAYEKEWRVFIPPQNILNPIVPKSPDGNEILFDLLTFNPKEISSVYFGCRMFADDKDKIKRCLTGDFEHVKKNECVRSRSNYGLEL
jgi:hypothetical protein